MKTKILSLFSLLIISASAHAQTVRIDGSGVFIGGVPGVGSTSINTPKSNMPPQRSTDAYLLSGSKKILTCEKDIEIQGNENIIQIKGPCDNVSIIGNDNQVTIESVNKFHLFGNDNKIKANPKIKEIIGNANILRP